MSKKKTATKNKKTMMKVEDLIHDPANVRKHDDRNIEAIKSSLARFGQQKPIVVNEENIVLAGNGTLAACRALGWDEMWVEITPLKGVEATAYSIADNRTAELAEWDADELAQMLSSLQNDDDIDHLVTGYTDEEIGKLVDKAMGKEHEGGLEIERILQVAVDCENEEQQREVYDMLMEGGYKCRVLTL